MFSNPIKNNASLEYLSDYLNYHAVADNASQARVTLLNNLNVLIKKAIRAEKQGNIQLLSDTLLKALTMIESVSDGKTTLKEDVQEAGNLCYSSIMTDANIKPVRREINKAADKLGWFERAVTLNTKAILNKVHRNIVTKYQEILDPVAMTDTHPEEAVINYLNAQLGSNPSEENEDKNSQVIGRKAAFEKIIATLSKAIEARENKDFAKRKHYISLALAQLEKTNNNGFTITESLMLANKTLYYGNHREECREVVTVNNEKKREGDETKIYRDKENKDKEYIVPVPLQDNELLTNTKNVFYHCHQHLHKYLSQEQVLQYVPLQNLHTLIPNLTSIEHVPNQDGEILTPMLLRAKNIMRTSPVSKNVDYGRGCTFGRYNETIEKMRLIKKYESIVRSYLLEKREITDTALKNLIDKEAAVYTKVRPEINDNIIENIAVSIATDEVMMLRKKKLKEFFTSYKDCGFFVGARENKDVAEFVSDFGGQALREGMIFHFTKELNFFDMIPPNQLDYLKQEFQNLKQYNALAGEDNRVNFFTPAYLDGSIAWNKEEDLTNGTKYYCDVDMVVYGVNCYTANGAITYILNENDKFKEVNTEEFQELQRAGKLKPVYTARERFELRKDPESVTSHGLVKHTTMFKECFYTKKIKPKDKARLVKAEDLTGDNHNCYKSKSLSLEQLAMSSSSSLSY